MASLRRRCGHRRAGDGRGWPAHTSGRRVFQVRLGSPRPTHALGSCAVSVDGRRHRLAGRRRRTQRRRFGACPLGRVSPRRLADAALGRPAAGPVVPRARNGLSDRPLEPLPPRDCPMCDVPARLGRGLWRYRSLAVVDRRRQLGRAGPSRFRPGGRCVAGHGDRVSRAGRQVAPGRARGLASWPGGAGRGAGGLVGPDHPAADQLPREPARHRLLHTFWSWAP